MPAEVKMMTRSNTLNRAGRRALMSRLIKSIDQRARTFHEAEDGGMAIVAFFVFLIMITMGSLSIDTMRHEMERTQLQAVNDSAALAGAGAPAGSTDDEIRAIVEDFFAKSGKGEYMNEIGDDDITATLNAREVTASAEMTVNTYLMRLMGVNSLTATSGSTAEVRTPKLEVSLVLDVSGSMRGDKLTNLQRAAKEFVTSVLNSADPGYTVISVVPFSWTVAPGAALYEQLTVAETHKYSTCLRFSEDDYDDAFINPDRAYAQQVYTSVYGSPFDTLNPSWRSCFNEEAIEILAYSINETALHNKIDAMTADGNTSGHIGMKWGAALLDPAFETVVTDMQLAGHVDNIITNVPAQYNEPESLKVVVMMGDGANTDSYHFNVNHVDETADYRGEDSDLLRVTWQDQEFSYAYHIYRDRISYDESRCSRTRWRCVYEATGPVQSAYYVRDNSFYNEDTDAWEVGYYSVQEDLWLTEAEFNDLENTVSGFIASEALDWEEAWGRMTPHWYGTLTGDWGPWNDFVGTGRVNGAQKDTRMSNVCGATKANDVVVYTIGFEVPAEGNAEVQLRNCATSAAHYYRASGVSISDAFGSIAANVQALRLTQ